MKFDNLYKIIIQQLTAQQKALTDQYTIQRAKDLSFGPIFKQQRTYFNIGKIKLSDMNIEIPEEIQAFLDCNNYACDNYVQGYAYKINDPHKRLISIGKILFKQFDKEKKSYNDKFLKQQVDDEYKELKKIYDQRLGGDLKEEVDCAICITHNPYDIAGMSTDRKHWTSCMNLDKGSFSDTPLKQVKYGGMVAYLIQKNDKNIDNPLARVAIKRLVSPNGGFIFLSENKIYGKDKFAEAAKFNQLVIQQLNKSNQLTKNNATYFLRNDDDSYSDSQLNSYFDYEHLNINDLTERQINEISDNPHTPKWFIEKYFDKLNHGYIFANINDTYKAEKFLEKYKDRLHWHQVCKYFNLFTQDIIDKYQQYFDFTNVVNNLDYISIDLLKQHFNELDLTEIIKNSYHERNENVLQLIVENHAQNKVNWYDVSTNYKYKLSALCFRLFKNYIDLDKYFENLDPYYFEQMILTQEYWDYIALNNKHMTLSDIQHYASKLKIQSLLDNKNISKQDKIEIVKMSHHGVKFA